MNVAIAVVTAAAVLLGASAFTQPAEAFEQGYQAYEIKSGYKKSRYKKRRYRAPHHTQMQYWADKLPVGSQAWWQQMDREGRGGRRR
jgi:hypothetical protein